jgi:hypothetical protein
VQPDTINIYEIDRIKAKTLVKPLTEYEIF